MREKKVYLIRGNDGKYKIGISTDPQKRILQLQTGNSEKLTLIDVYESSNAHKIESTLHKLYSFSRNEGEWFDLSVLEESNFLKNCKRIDDSLKTLKEMGNFYV